MKQLYIHVCFFLLLLFYFILLSCNNASKESDSTIVENIAASGGFKSLDSFEINEDSSKFRNSNLEVQGFGENDSEKKTTISRKLDNLLVFHVDDTMNLKETYRATLALARNAALDPLIQSVLRESEASDDSVIVDSTIQLGKRVRAKLLDVGPRDDKSFRIEPFGTDEQNLDKTKERYWQWNIEPLKEGPHKLLLTVEVIYGDNNEMNLPARNIPIIIFAKKVSFSTKVGNFFSNYWQWVITGILLPILIALLTNWIKRR